MENWYVYIAKAKTQRFYIGISNEPENRIIEHNLGRGSRFAINQGPLQLVYISSPFVNKSEARKREIQVKKRSRVKKLKLIKGEWI
ncbi:MAG: GIY-YIG nuclease family protein [Candidatus Omnitrophota bacterium]|jgi:putative endonuclease